MRLRIGLHTGEPAVGEEGYTGLDVVRASRLAAIGRGGQVLLSDTTRAIVADDLPEGVSLRSLGEQPLRDIERPEPLSELIISDVSVTPPSTDRTAALADTPPARAADMPPDLPDFLLGSARRFIPGGEKTRDLIEQRVLESITKAFEDGASRRRRRDRDVEPPEVPKPSMADEIDRLRSLRDSGAMNEEQYARAVDRVVGAGPDEPA